MRNEFSIRCVIVGTFNPFTSGSGFRNYILVRGLPMFIINICDDINTLIKKNH